MDFQCIFVAAGEVLCREGDPGDCAYIIEDGLIEISVERDGKQVVVAKLGPGEIFGEMAIITSSKRSATAMALEDCNLRRIEAQQFIRRLETMDPVMRTIVEMILARFRSTLKLIDTAPRMMHRAALAPMPHTVEALRSLRFESELAQAVQERQFKPFYQPIVCLRTGRLAGFEALVRWDHPERGVIAPSEFIPIAEQSDLITEITSCCLKAVCQHLPEMRVAGLRNVENVWPVFVSANITAQDIEKEGFLEEIQALLAQSGLSTDMLKLEVTESSIMANLEYIGAVLRKLRRLGLSIAVDDFGTGYSSMSHLTKLPVSALKIDRSFVTAMDQSAQDEKVVLTILRLARELDLMVVAEGVGSHGCEAVLAEHGCTFGQGYLYAEPMPLDEAMVLIENWTARVAETTGDAFALNTVHG